MNKETRDRVSNLARFFVVPTVLGLLAGVVGGMYVFSYYLGGLTEMPLQAPSRPTFAVTAPLAETELAARLRSMDLRIYPKRSATQASEVDRVLNPSASLGVATVLTSDGWLITHASVLKSGPVQVALDGRLVDPKQVVQDPATGAALLKIEANSLVVAGLEDTFSLKPGTALFLADEGDRFTRTWFAGTTPVARSGRPAALASSDQFSRSWRLDRTVDSKAVGGAVLTVGGNLAGIILPSTGGATFLPMHLFRSSLSDLFRGQTAKRPTLGLNYVDLATATLSGAPASAEGLLVTGSKRDGIPAVVTGGAAALAGVKEGDILIRLDDTDLLSGHDLAEILAEYKPGAKISIDLLRGGERRTVQVTLK